MTSPEINTYEPHKEPSEEIWSSSPGWFRRALEIPMGHGAVEVDGASIHFLTWGEVGRPGLVFVHGGGANAYWWAHIAAQFADDFRVLAVDMSGHGDSGQRQK